jgi:hypothetical protein
LNLAHLGAQFFDAGKVFKMNNIPDVWPGSDFDHGATGNGLYSQDAAARECHFCYEGVGPAG